LGFHGARFVGPAIAGVGIAGGSVSLAFLLNAVSYLGFIVALSMLDVPASPVVPRQRLLRQSFDGYAYALRHPGIRPIFLLFAVTSLGLRGFIELFPGFADQVFARGAEGLAWLAATVGLGAVAGGLWMAGRQSVSGLTSLIILNSLLLSVAGLGFAATSNYWVALICVFLCGFAMVATGIAAQTLIQSAVDPAMRGRVLGFYGLIFRAGPALNALVLGALSSEFGLRLPLAVGAILCLLVWAWARLQQSAVARALEIDASEMPAA
ncbi:MAG TPA: MFS transporter, partial [Stellaceae bacterium]|nr:MFS transporter [Stellaceae bacterium]